MPPCLILGMIVGLSDIVGFLAMMICFSIVFYFGPKINKTNWGITTKVVVQLLLIMVALGVSAVVLLTFKNLFDWQ